MTPAELRENVFARKLMQTVYADSPALSSKAFEISFESGFYHKLVNSFTWQVELPITICFAQKHSGQKDVVVHTEPGNERFRKAKELIERSRVINENYSEQDLATIFDAALEEIAQRLPTSGEPSILYELRSDLSFQIWEQTHDVDERFQELVEQVWDAIADMLTEISVVDGINQILRVKDGFFGLYDLPDDIAEACFDHFSCYHDVVIDMIERIDLAIRNIECITEVYPREISGELIDEASEYLQRMAEILRRFDAQITQKANPNIRLYDRTVTGFLENPLPLM